MNTLARLLCLLVLSAALQAQPSLDNARRARALLGPEVWSNVIRVENTAAPSAYPPIVHALVFEFAGILWFYTDTDGTQSFSLHRDNLAAEKADFGPLLRDIEPGFRRWTVLPDVAWAPDAVETPLANGCFIESIVALRARVARGMPTDQPRLLSYYHDISHGRRGHTVLAYSVGASTGVFDPARRTDLLVLATSDATDPLVLARALEGPDVMKARFLPIPMPAVASPVASAGAAAQNSRGS